jgi:hypothetical protein
MNEAVKNTTSLTPLDGYDDDGSPPSLRGAKYLKFDGATPTLWFLREGGTPAKKGPYFAPDCWEEQVKWTADKTVAEKIRKQPGEPFPDVESLNAKTPEDEYIYDFNDKLVGPWRHTFNVGLVDTDTGARFIASNSTTGMAIAYEELRSAVQFKRKARGEHVIPVIELSSAPMRSKKYGIRTIPRFEVIDCRTFGGSTPAVSGPVDPIPGTPVAPITASEIVNDSMPTWDDPIPDSI